MSGSDAGATPVRADIPPDSTPDTRWLSYRELAEIMAPTKVESVIRLVRRKGWPKRDSNNGVRVAVPADILADMRARQGRGLKPVAAKPGNVPADIPPDDRADISVLIKPLEAAIAALQERLARADGQAADLQAQLTAARADAAEERSRADRAEGMAEGLRAARSGGFAAWWRSMRAAFRP